MAVGKTNIFAFSKDIVTEIKMQASDWEKYLQNTYLVGDLYSGTD